MVRDRGRRAVLALLRGEWDTPIADLCEIFEVDPPPRRTTPPPARPAPPRASPFRLGDYQVPIHPWLRQKFSPVVNPELLQSYRGRTCVACWVPGIASGHHLIERSYLRLDVEWNLLPLCDRCHLKSWPFGFHQLGPYRWLRHHRDKLARDYIRQVMVVCFVIRPWLDRNGREGPSIVIDRGPYAPN